jgi:hypothetical protein
MPFIEQQIIVSTVELKVKIEEPVVKQLETYSEFVKSPVGYVVQELVRKAMAKDKEFQAHLGNVKTRRPRRRRQIEEVTSKAVEAVA